MANPSGSGSLYGDTLPIPGANNRDVTPMIGNPDLSIPIDQQLVHNIDMMLQITYMEQYWQHFHQVFPIIHRPTFLRTETSALVATAMMAIGAQYMDTASSQQHAKYFYESCMKHIVSTFLVH